MKNIQAQYQDLLEGKMSHTNFMRSVRRDFPQFISPVTSYDDSVKILKGKRILSEVSINPTKRLSINESEIFSIAVEDEILDRASQKEITDAEAKAAKNFISNNDLELEKFEFSGQGEAGGGVMEATDFVIRQIRKNKSLNEDKQPKGVYGHNPNAENPVNPGIDQLNYYQVYHGIQYELAKMPEITDENYMKARKKVVDTILKDPDAYKNLQIANFKKIKEMDKDLEMKDVKENNRVDKANGLKAVAKDAKANTEDTLGNKEKRKAKNGKGLQHMTQTPKGKLEAFATPGKEKVKALKENIMREMTKINPEFEHYNVGARVKKKDNSLVGEITEWDGDTATIKTDDGQIHHVQGNVLTKKDVPNPQEKPYENPLAKMPNLGNLGQSWASSQTQVKEDISNNEKINWNWELATIDDYDVDEFNKEVAIGTITGRDAEGNIYEANWAAPAGDYDEEDGLEIDYDTADFSNIRMIEDADGNEIQEETKESRHLKLKEKLVKALKKEMLYKNKKTGNVQSFDPNHPDDKEVLKDPQFNQIFTKA